jgi:CrcB protein
VVIQPHELDDTATPDVKAVARRAPAPRRRHARWQAVGSAATLYAAVALGTVIGGVLRAIASLAIHGHAEAGFPWATLFVNATGSFLIGLYATLSGPDGRLFAGPTQRQFVLTGICGGYTTFSVFSLETFRLLQAGNLPAAGINVAVSVVAWLAAVWAGHTIATRLNRLTGA